MVESECSKHNQPSENMNLTKKTLLLALAASFSTVLSFATNGLVTRGTAEIQLIFVDGNGNNRVDATGTISVFQTSCTYPDTFELNSSDGVVFTATADANDPMYPTVPFIACCLTGSNAWTWASIHYANYTVSQVMNSWSNPFPDEAAWGTLTSKSLTSTDSFSGTFFGPSI